MEYWDLLDKDRQPLGKTHPRGRQYPLPDGAYHLVVYILTLDGEGRLLITRRSENKRGYPGFWEFTGGSAVAGEDSITSARRELLEETGLDVPAEDVTLLTTMRFLSAFVDVYLARPHGTADTLSVTLQEGETCDSRWVTLREFEEMLRTDHIPPTLAMVYGAVRAQVMAAMAVAATGKEAP